MGLQTLYGRIEGTHMRRQTTWFTACPPCIQVPADPRPTPPQPGGPPR